MTEAQIRAEQAKQITESPVFVDACRRMQDHIDRQRAGTGWNEVKKREALFVKERLLAEFCVELSNIISMGEVREAPQTIRERLVENWRGKFPLRIK